MGRKRMSQRPSEPRRQLSAHRHAALAGLGARGRRRPRGEQVPRGKSPTVERRSCEPAEAADPGCPVGRGVLLSWGCWWSALARLSPPGRGSWAELRWGISEAIHRSVAFPGGLCLYLWEIDKVDSPLEGRLGVFHPFSVPGTSGPSHLSPSPPLDPTFLSSACLCVPTPPPHPVWGQTPQRKRQGSVLGVESQVWLGLF